MNRLMDVALKMQETSDLIGPELIASSAVERLKNTATIPIYPRVFHEARLGDTVPLEGFRDKVAVLAYRKNVTREVTERDRALKPTEFGRKYIQPMIQAIAAQFVRDAASHGIHDPMLVMGSLSTISMGLAGANSSAWGVSVRAAFDYDIQACEEVLYIDVLYGIASDERA